ncbi:DNA/RNA nuclease SfsA [Neobacillus citreus]|uniref:DNA/RNA nuclease SfsA n=1 Tax=Neobacillus citreus TaxID=2833578 RepID=A0A942T406_9BACI|nr:DNA/RNA nuclease SfsA [Neobacillus citreus]MCH6265328.1 DNA/RNA nuclease SfsA [Neobacillus citreus]
MIIQNIEIIEGKFIKESKNRFLCEVLIDGQVEECYVSNTSKIGKYINLSNKTVLLSKNKGIKGRTRFSLFAVKYYCKFILLNFNKVNELLAYYFKEIEMKGSNVYTVEQEKIFNGYKADLIIREKGLNEKIIEAKAILDIKHSSTFPKVHSERAINQLIKINSLLSNGHSIEYFLVSLSPIVRQIIIDRTYKEYYKLLNECIERGLIIKGVSVDFRSGNNITFNELKIVIT